MNLGDKKIVRIILFLLMTNISSPSFAQSNKYCDSLAQKIKEAARRHSHNNDKMMTDVILNLFKGQDSCYSPGQIAEMYELEYTMEKKAESSPWKQLLPGLGWISTIVLLFFIVFRDYVKKIVDTVYKHIGNWVYRKFSGSKLFRRRALAKYRNALVLKYREIKIVFRPNRPLKMQEVFIPLKVVDTQDKEQMDVLRSVSIFNKVVVIGEPGSGKSMLCKNLLFNYGTSKSLIKNIPVLLELHRLSEQNTSIEKLLEEELARNDFPNATTFLDQNLRQGKLLLLLDGYDEITSNYRQTATKQICDFIDKYKKCRFVITSRVAVYKNEFSDFVEKTLRMVEFNHHQIRLFLESWSKGMSHDKSIDQLMIALQERPRIMAMATNPLLLTIIAYLYTDTPHKFPQSRGEFYELSTDILLKQWHIEHNQFDARDKAVILQRIALINQDATNNNSEDRKLIHYTKAREEIIKLLPSLDQSIHNVQTIIDEIIERSGLLISVDRGEYYQFAHLTMQEYYAAKQLINEPVAILDRFKKDGNVWRETLKLWCGLAADASEMVSEIFNIDPIVAFECVADSRSINPEIADMVVNHFKLLLFQESNYKSEIEKAFGIIASDARPRGRELFTYLKETLQYADKWETIALSNALSYTYLPEAAELIANQYTRCDEVQNSLLRMGEIGVPAITKVGKDVPEVLFVLREIATPNAALALVDFIWQENEAAKISAWLLADLLKNPSIEEALGECVIMASQKTVTRLDWVWQPFDSDSSSSLSIIASRISYLITNSNAGFKIKWPIELDKRISIPLFIYRKTFLIGENIDREKVSNLMQASDTLVSKMQSANTFTEDLLDYIENSKIKNKALTILSVKKGTENIDIIISKMPDSLSFELIRRINNSSRNPVKEDWINVYRKLTYDPNNGWHFRAILFIFYNLNFIAFWTWLNFVRFNYLNLTPWNALQIIGGSMAVMALIIHSFFRVASRGPIVKTREEFAILGFLGFIFFPIILIQSVIKNDRDDFMSSLKFLYAFFWFPFLWYYDFTLAKTHFNTFGIIFIHFAISFCMIFLAIKGTMMYRKSKNPLRGILEKNYDGYKRKNKFFQGNKID